MKNINHKNSIQFAKWCHRIFEEFLTCFGIKFDVSHNENFEKLKCKKSKHLGYGKMLVIKFPYMINH